MRIDEFDIPPERDAEMEQLAELLSNRVLADCGKRQRQRFETLKVDLVRRGVSGSGLEEQGKIQIADSFIDEYSEQMKVELLELVRKTTGTIGEHDGAWIRTRLETALDQLRRGQAGSSIESPEGQRHLGDYIQRKKAGLAAAINIEVRTARLEASKQAEANDLDEMVPQLRKKAAFHRDLDSMAGAAAQKQRALALVLLDGDGFKQINDTHGHDVGDEVIRALGALMAEQVRGNGQGYRTGGDEFAVLLPGRSVTDTRAFAEVLRVAIERAVLTGRGLRLTATLGVGCLPAHAADGQGLFHVADQALLRAKKNGRNRVEVGQHPSASGARFCRDCPPYFQGHAAS